MSNTTTKILAGCGVGCLLFLVALGGLGWMGYRWTKTAVEAVEEAELAEDRLEAEYGRVRDYLPPLDGQVQPLRMEAFLSVRDSMAAERETLAEAVVALAPSDGEGRTVGGLRAVRAALKLAPGILDFAKARNNALLEHEMGPGEYAWIYWLTFNAWLGHSAGESLLDEFMEARAEAHESMEMHIDGMDTVNAKRLLRGNIVAMLHNLERELAAKSETSELHDLVAAELAAVDADSERVPWQDGLPGAFAVGLEPYRDRLEASYSPATNPFELLELDPGPHGVTIE